MIKKRVTAGAAAGVIATLPMSAVMWGFKKLGWHRSRPHPERVSEGILSKVVDVRKLPPKVQLGLHLSQHAGFGAAAGSVFALAGTLLKPSVLTGVLAGLAIWKVNYDGWLPRAGILPPPEHDEQGRVRTTLVAHVAYGAVLGGILQWWAGKEHAY